MGNIHGKKTALCLVDADHERDAGRQRNLRVQLVLEKSLIGPRPRKRAEERGRAIAFSVDLTIKG
jgi:hypothetical protein